MDSYGFQKLLNILDAAELEYSFTDNNDLHIETPNEDDFVFVNEMLHSLFHLGEFYTGNDDEYVEVPEFEIPEDDE